MTKKSRDYRVLKRAINLYKKVLDKTVGYNTELLMADLNLKRVSREFYNKYPKQYPKIKYYTSTKESYDGIEFKNYYEDEPIVF